MWRSVFGTRGASDCAGCVGVALEAARVLVANPNLTLPGPAVFLFNGGEETLLQASHGFMAHSRCSLQGTAVRGHITRRVTRPGTHCAWGALL